MTAKQRRPGAKSVKAAKTMLVAIDFSPESRRALQNALGLAREFSRLILLHVIPSAASETGHEPAHVLSTVQERLREFCQQDDGLVAPELIQMRIRRGTPFREILDCAKENAVEMIVLGVDESSSLGGVALGHTADRVSRYAPCAVLLIRETRTSPVSSKDQLRPKRKKK